MVKIRLRYVSEDRDRHGNVRLYLRLPGRAKVRLHEMPGTEAFLAEYQAAVAGFAPRPVAARRLEAETGTLLWLCTAYAATGEFRSLDARTQRVRRRILETCCAEPIAPGKAPLMGALPVRRMPPKVITALRDRKVDLPEAANGRVKAFRQVFAWAVGAGHADLNPAREVAYLAPEAGGFTAWSEQDVQRFEAAHPVGTKARLALALLLYTGQRRSDVVRLGPQHVRDGWITFTQAKNARRAPITLTIPLHPELARIIKATPGSGALAFLVTEFGRPFTANGFGNRFRKWCETAGVTDLAAHGLRKAAAARLAEAGATDREIMAITGHRTAKEVTRYTASADQKKRAQNGMAKWAAVPLTEADAIQWDNQEEKVCGINGSKGAVVPRGGIEPPTLRFSVACSTN